MHRGIVVPILAPAVAVWLGVTGCTADSGDGGILVLKNVAADAMCKVMPSESEAGLSHGSLDLLIPTSYLFIAQMKSRITALTGQEDQRTIITSGANVDIEFPNSSVFSATELAELRMLGLTHYKSLFSAAIRPNGGITDAGFTLIPGELTQRIATKIGSSPTRIEAVATFTIVGDMSGAEIASQPFSFPITIGNGVVINIPTPSSCPLPKDFGMPRTGYACNPAQDGVVDCCVQAGAIRCPATIATM